LAKQLRFVKVSMEPGTQKREAQGMSNLKEQPSTKVEPGGQAGQGPKGLSLSQTTFLTPEHFPGSLPQEQEESSASFMTEKTGNLGSHS
jgi:hypothetical protein